MFRLIKSILLDPLGSLFCVVCKNDICSSPLEASQSLQNNSLLVQPSLLNSSLQHGILSTDMVGSNRQIRVVFQPTNDVQIRHSRLNHEHISSLSGIKSSFDECLTSIRRILLVSLFVSESRVRVKSITEGSIVCRSVFGSVGEDGNIGEALRVKSITNSFDTSVLHITGSNDISSGPSLRNSLLAKLVHGNIVQDNSILNNTIMSLIRIRIQRHIGTNDSLRILFLNHANRTMHNSLRIVSLTCQVRLQSIIHLRKQHERLNSQLQSLSNLIKHGRQRMTLTSRH
mmetsp:Transcript_113/g.273  ORF Transcript_113/g.273 Transcript_113/m.273 type:complete len:286 (-) Transcript_113:416-1273(-)